MSSNNVDQAFCYSKSIDENTEQIKRLERGLRKHPDVVESLFSRKPEDLTLVPVILNSMTYSRDPVEGVYISDWPALSKFFTESTISCIGLQNGNKVKQAMIHNLWKGKRPTAKELLDYLEMPIQLQLMGKHLRSSISNIRCPRTQFSLRKNWMLMKIRCSKVEGCLLPRRPWAYTSQRLAIHHSIIAKR